MQTLANTPPASQHASAEVGPRPLIRVKDIAWLVYLYPARWLARVLPLRWLYALADTAAVCGSACLRRPRKALIERLAVAFHADTADPRLSAIATQYFRNAILRFFDDLLMERLLRQPRLPDVEFVHLENLQQALSAGRGALLVSGHFFASILAKRYLATMGFPSLSVRNHQPADRNAGRFGMRFVQKRYVAFIGQILGDEVSTQDPDCSLKMLARLRSGGLVHLLVDASISQELVKLTFLGQERNFPAGFLRVAQLAGCPLVPIHCLGNSRRLRIEFEKAFWLENAPDRRSFAEINLRETVRILEEQITSHPAEWDLWIRW
ncbi:MAG: lysophospholipid acyltransferase family protein [Bryobacteraceae bacterium]|jgi:KDO2-lipid IV(A) lauroyltransferase